MVGLWAKGSYGVELVQFLFEATDAWCIDDFPWKDVPSSGNSFLKHKSLWFSFLDLVMNIVSIFSIKVT